MSDFEQTDIEGYNSIKMYKNLTKQLNSIYKVVSIYFKVNQYQRKLNMRRPQSAKPGYKGYWGQGSSQQFNDQDNNTSKNQHRKNVKIMKPDLTTNDFARILPKKIYQDKERLYSQALQLKQNLNQTLQENVRLKTRISILQKEKDKMNKHIQMGKDTGMTKTNSRLNIYSMKNNQKQNMMIRNLKKMVRQSKQQNDYLKQENAKIKKAIKYTKINEIQIERKMLQDQNKRINNLLQEMNEQLGNQDDYERENAQLKRYLQEEVQNNKQMNESNQKYLEYIESLEQKLKIQSDKHLNKENKLQREFALNKRKLNQSLRQIQDLRNQLKYLKQNNSNQTKKKPAAKLVRPVTSNPYKSNNQQQVRVSTQDKRQTEQLKQVKLQNQQLKNQLNEAKSKLQLSERQTNIQVPKQNTKDGSETNKVSQRQANKAKTPRKQNNKDNNQPFIMESPQNNKSNTYQQNYQQPDYEQDYEQSTTRLKKQQAQIQKYRKDFQQEQEEQPLYIKNDPKQQNSSKKNLQKKQKVKSKDQNAKQEKKKKKADGKYKPDKKILTQIKQILTYRMKAQRYPYEQLKKDIQQASQKKFSYSELKTMFNNQPFYMHLPYIQAMLKYCFQKQKVKQTETLSSQTLVAKLRKVIDDFELIEQKEEEQMLARISQMVVEYPTQLQAAFEKIKNGEETVAKKDIIQMFKKLELQDKYIELIITELSLCSQNLQHLNFHGFFQRFYLDMAQQGQNNQIDEQQIQSSSQEQSKNLKGKDSAKLRQIRNEFEDDGQNQLAIDDGQRISLGDDHKDYDQDVVSDDGPI